VVGSAGGSVYTPARDADKTVADLMKKDYLAHKDRYHQYWSKELNPSSSFFYRRIPTLIDFLVSTKRWEPARKVFRPQSWGGG
jgi:hypothetical protein